MLNFSNILDTNIIQQTDMFVACVGYEERSFSLYDKYKGIFEDKCFVVTIDDYTLFEKSIQDKIEEIKNEISKFDVLSYGDAMGFQDKVLDRIHELQLEKDSIQIDIDYSSMPRGWYCALPERMCQMLRNDDKVNFWYSEGEYVESADSFVSVGIESYKMYSGRTSFDTQRGRTHFIGIGYDSARTQGILSILDPEEYVIIDAYNPSRKEIHDDVVKVNASVIEQTSISLSLFVNDIEFMIAKIKGLVREYHSLGNSDVILVPDGPKPLIFCMSMMPWLIGKEGICCLHIMRNNKDIKRINVKPQGGVIGFQFSVNN